MSKIIRISLLILVSACSKPIADLSEINKIIIDVKEEYAPDKRVAIYQVEAQDSAGTVVLRGETNLKVAKTALMDKIALLDVQLIDKIRVLDPAPGIVNISVANLRSQPKHSAELSTQALLGTKLNVYKKQNGWYLVQTPDLYLGWTDFGGLVQVSEEEIKQYEKADKMIYTEFYGFVLDEKGKRISDIALGDLLVIVDEMDTNFKVRFPDGRQGYVSREEALRLDDWLHSISNHPQDLVSTSFDFMGIPYLWGGTSSKGVDCSGFTKMVYLMNGRIIPRDASQQIHSGILVDDEKDFSKLDKGDLLFFGKAATDSTRERVIHVGMWIGDNKYIHSSGKVKVNSMDENDPLYNEFRYNTYLRSKRILNHEVDGAILLTKE